MGLLSSLFASNKTKKNSSKEKTALKEKKCYENIDFDNIAYVTFDGTEAAYRVDTEEEFDPVMSDFLTRQDGWQHYETKTVEYKVENGENYCFTIKYKNDTQIQRKFHESSSIAKRLLEYSNRIESSQGVELSNNDEIQCLIDDIIKEANNVSVEIGKIFSSQPGDNDCEKGIKSYKEKESHTMGQKNALREAETYLRSDSYSKSDLIEQLKYDGYTEEEATYAANNVKVEWNEQCYKTAEAYLRSDSFSKSDLIGQLEYDGFTEEEIKYAIKKVKY